MPNVKTIRDILAVYFGETIAENAIESICQDLNIKKGEVSKDEFKRLSMAVYFQIRKGMGKDTAEKFLKELDGMVK